MSSSYERTAGSRKRFDAWGIAGWVFLFILLLFTVIPIGVDALHRLQNPARRAAIPAPTGFPKTRRWNNFKVLLDPNDDIGRRFLRYMLNSLWVSTATTVIGVLVAVPAAYAFSRFRFPGKNALFYGVLLRNMFPAVIFLIPLFILMRNLHLVNSYLSLIITYLTFGLPLSIWLLKGFYDNIPVQLEQAARIDGASRFQAFLYIVMPLSAPGIVATAIYSFILAWNEYVYALTFITDDQKLTVPVGLQRFFSEYVANWPGLMAAAFLMSVPVVVMFMLLQKYFVRALTEGAVKQ